MMKKKPMLKKNMETLFGSEASDNSTKYDSLIRIRRPDKNLKKQASIKVKATVDMTI